MNLDEAMDKVAQFHRMIGEVVGETPIRLECEPSQALKVAGELRGIIMACSGRGSHLLSRVCLSLEETAEFLEAHAKGDITAVADAVGDRLFVLLGDAIACGLPLCEIFKAICDSNLTKAMGKMDGRGKGIKGSDYRDPTDAIQSAIKLRRDD